MKNFNLLLIFIITYFTICNVFSQVSTSDITYTNNINITNTNNMEEEDDMLYGPVRFTESGLKCFFSHKFNHPKYSQDFLPHNLSDLVQFLEYSKATNQNKRFIKTTLKIFNQKFKSLTYLGAKEFTQFISKLPSLIDYSFIAPIYEEQSSIKNLLWNEFLNKYQFFQEAPRHFFCNITEQIGSNIIKKNMIVLNDITADDLRSTIVRFIETGLSKSVWFIEDEPDVWTQFNETCQAIIKLKETNLIYDLEDINDLINSALDRFLFVIDVRGSNLPTEFYEKVWRDIHNNPPSWIELAELDDLIETKKAKLLQVIKASHTKSFARQNYGLITS